MQIYRRHYVYTEPFPGGGTDAPWLISFFLSLFHAGLVGKQGNETSYVHVAWLYSVKDNGTEPQNRQEILC